MPHAMPFRSWAAFLGTLLTLTFSGIVGAQTNDTATPGTIAAELDELGRYLAAHQGKDACKERCFVLDRLSLKGSVGDGALTFELSGGVLSSGATAVPLFGPPSTVRIEVEGKDAAAIGFEGDHYSFTPPSGASSSKGASGSGPIWPWRSRARSTRWRPIWRAERWSRGRAFRASLARRFIFSVAT